MKNHILTFALIALTFFSCNSTKTSDSAQKEISEQEVTTDDTDSHGITNKHWKLITLEGRSIEMVENQEREIFFTLDPEENRIMGFAGCNTITGNYKLEKGNRIRFSSMASTLKACPDVDINENEFSEVFELADNYTIDGNKLSLNVGKRAPLAVFEKVANK